MARNDRRKAVYLRFVGWAKDARLTRESDSLMELEAPSQSGRWRGLNPRMLEWAMMRTGCQRGKESGISKANIFCRCFKSGYKGEEMARETASTAFSRRKVEKNSSNIHHPQRIWRKCHAIQLSPTSDFNLHPFFLPASPSYALRYRGHPQNFSLRQMLRDNSPPIVRLSVIRFNRMQLPVVVCSPLYTSRVVNLMRSGNR